MPCWVSPPRLRHSAACSPGRQHLGAPGRQGRHVAAGHATNAALSASKTGVVVGQEKWSNVLFFGLTKTKCTLAWSDDSIHEIVTVALLWPLCQPRPAPIQAFPSTRLSHARANNLHASQHAQGLREQELPTPSPAVEHKGAAR